MCGERLPDLVRQKWRVGMHWKEAAFSIFLVNFLTACIGLLHCISCHSLSLVLHFCIFFFALLSHSLHCTDTVGSMD